MTGIYADLISRLKFVIGQDRDFDRRSSFIGKCPDHYGPADSGPRGLVYKPCCFCGRFKSSE